MPATLIQTVNPSVSTGSITVSPTQTLLGSLILVFIGSSALTDTVSTVTDNAGNVYTKAYSVASGTGGDTELWYCLNAQPTNSIVVTFSASVSTKSVIVREYSGIIASSNGFDKQVTASGSGTSPSSGATAAISDATELVVSSCSCLGTSPTLSVGAGFGNYTSQALIAGASLHAVQDLITSSIATQTGLMTAGGTLPVWDIGIATFIIKPSNTFNNFSFARAASGMSVTEKIR